MLRERRNAAGSPEKKRSADDEIVDRLDEIRLAISGARRLAMEAEDDDEPTLIVIEVAALLGFAAEALDRIVRELDPSRSE